MTVLVARRVLWISLLLIFPVPVLVESWGWLTVLAIGQLLFTTHEYSAMTLLSLPLMLQWVLWIVALWAAAYSYGLLAAAWPAKLRGSIMGIIVFTALLTFSTIAVYVFPFLSTGSSSPTSVTFLNLY